MRLSTKGRYGLKAMVDLALHYQGEVTPLGEIAERQGISGAYLEQLMSSLRKSGLVHSVRGAQGGYKLTRPPEEITVGEVLRSLEGPLAPVECVDETGAGCSRMDDCYTVVVWERLRDAINGVLDSTSLADLLDQAHQKEDQ
ncbi:MAG: Rrf2 family transcriptional regulator [Firmicutes bacterium]|nr:Rrf2 family transcriptional regulator [Bacillota bacterium]